jgi:hypothetical protein
LLNIHVPSLPHGLKADTYVEQCALCGVVIALVTEAITEVGAPKVDGIESDSVWLEGKEVSVPTPCFSLQPHYHWGSCSAFFVWKIGTKKGAEFSIPDRLTVMRPTVCASCYSSLVGDAHFIDWAAFRGFVDSTIAPNAPHFSSFRALANYGFALAPSQVDVRMEEAAANQLKHNFSVLRRDKERLGDFALIEEAGQLEICVPPFRGEDHA